VTDSLVLTNARIILAEEVINGTLHIADGRIEDIDEGGRSQAPSAIDLGGDYLMPGIVDLHTDSLEKHIMPRPGVRFNPVLAAMAHDAQIISSGITTVLNAICIGSSLRNPERNDILMPMVDGIRTARARGLLRADHQLHMRCEITDAGVVELFEPFANDPLTRMMSVMDHSPGQRQSPDLEKYKRKQLSYRSFVPEELDRAIEELMYASRTIGPANRAALVEMGRSKGIPLASHDDETVDHITQATGEGIVICEFPTTFDAAEAARANGLQILMGSPNIIRGGSHTGNVGAAALARRGLLDIVSSDYVPISLLQSAFALTADDIGYDLTHAIRTVTLNPANAVGLTDRGSVARTKRADLVRVSLVEGLPVVRSVWVEGRQVY
jgi:alpha-D-ribose 1-methylphosphonate 5-triphosphate diphosphatase